MAYTLRDMIQMEAFQELQVIAGKEGLDNPVRYVGVLEAPDSVDFVKEHEFILTTGYVFTGRTDQMLDIIRQLHERNAAALGIKMFRYIQALPEEAVRLADEFHFPIFFIPNKYSWHELILPLILNISAGNAEDGGLYQDYDQLIYGMQHSQTIYDFISRAGELLQKPLTLLNKRTGEQIHYPADYRPDQMGQETWIGLLGNGNAYGIQNGKVHYYRPDKKKAGFLAAELYMQEYQYLILWDSPEPSSLNQFNYLVYSMVLVSDSMQNRRTAQKNQIVQKSLTLQKILMEQSQEESQMEALGVHIREADFYSPALARFKEVPKEQGRKSQSESSQGRVLTENPVMEERITVYNPVVVRLLEQVYQKWKIHGFSDSRGRLQFLIPYEKEDRTPPQMLSAGRKISSGLQKTVQGYFPDLEVQVVTGRPGKGWDGLKKRHRELMETAEFLKEEKGEQGEQPLLHLHDLGIQVLLANQQVRGELNDWMEEYFWPLEQLEPGVRQKILEAARAYVKAGFNTREAARLLGVHHNTIRNRLEQILILTGLEISREEDLLILLLYLIRR